MDTVRQLIIFFLKFAFAFFLAAVVYWLVSIFVPGINFKSIIPTPKGSGTHREDILPSPRKYANLFGQAKPSDVNTNVYVPAAPYTPGAPYNGYGNIGSSKYTYSTYTYSNATGNSNTDQTGSGVIIATTTYIKPAPAPLSINNAYIRNLSIYKGSHIRSGLYFTGEARSSMFREGKFPIVLLDKDKKVIGVSAGVAETNWAVPGWVRFTTKIGYPVPPTSACTIIFEEALTQTERIRQPLRMPLEVFCN